MKTAVQELIEMMEDAKSKKFDKIDWLVIMKVYSTEKREKDQMINFHKWMKINEKEEKYFHYSDEDMLNEYLNRDI
jgi:UDP-N-acetylmuramate-alanine ligase